MGPRALSDMDERLQVLSGLRHLILRSVLSFFDFSLFTVQIKTINYSRERRFILHYHMNMTRKKQNKKERKARTRNPLNR